MQTVLTWIRRVLTGVIVAAAGLFLFVLIWGNWYRISGERRAAEQFSPPGEMVSVGTHRMHIYCIGSGRPTVILDGPVSSPYSAWVPAMRLIEPVTRVCAFDRSGLGYSEVGPVDPPTIESRMRDQELLLANSGEAPPYIIGGYSLGAQLAYQYAQRHLDETAALVIVEGASPEMRAMTFGRSFVPPVLDSAVILLEKLGLGPLIVSYTRREIPEPLRERLGLDEFFVNSHFVSKRMIGDVIGARSMNDAFNDQRHLGDVPLVVLMGAETGRQQFQDDPEALRKFETFKAEFSNRSNNGRFVPVPGAVHGTIMIEKELIAAEILRQVREWRRRNGLTDE